MSVEMFAKLSRNRTSDESIYRVNQSVGKGANRKVPNQASKQEEICSHSPDNEELLILLKRIE